MYNGFLNTYSFTKEGKKITLAPLSPSQLHKDKPQTKHHQSYLLLTFSEPLLKAFYHEFQAFKEWILSIQDESETPLPSHPIAKALIHNFYHLFPEEIPMGLSPKKISNTTLT